MRMMIFWVSNHLCRATLRAASPSSLPSSSPKKNAGAFLERYGVNVAANDSLNLERAIVDNPRSVTLVLAVLSVSMCRLQDNGEEQKAIREA